MHDAAKLSEGPVVALAVGLERTKLATAHVLPVGKYRAKLPCEFGKLLAAGMLLRNGATSASPRVLVSALLRVALEGPRFFTLLLSGAHVGG